MERVQERDREDVDRGNAPTTTQGRPAKRRKTAGAPPASVSTVTHAASVRGGGGDGEVLQPTLDHLPVDVLFEIMSWLPGWTLAAAACTCRAIEAVARDSRLWEAAYRRDIAHGGPPAEHADHVAHGKDIRWLYGLMRAAPGRLREGPTGRLTGRLVAADGVNRQSGEFGVVLGDSQGAATLSLNGYGAIVTKCDDTNTLCTVQGQCAAGQFVGALTIQWIDASAYASGLAATRVYRGAVTRPGEAIAQGGDTVGKMRVLGGRALTGRCVSNDVVVPGCIYSGQCDDGAPGARGALRLPDGAVREYWCHVPCDGDRDAHWGAQRPADNRALVTRAAYDIVSDDAEDNGDATRVTLSVHHGIGRLRDGPERAALDPGDGLFVMAAGWPPRAAITRACHAGHVLVWMGSEPFFLAVSHGHADRRIAGLRVLGDGPRIRALLDLADATEPSLDCLVALDRANPEVVTRALAKVGPLKEADHADPLQEYRPCDDEHFGVVIDQRGDGGQHWVRCFLTGRRVEARRCAFFTTGRLYESRALERWAEATRDWPCDPETGETVVGNALRIMWRPWMAPIPSDLLQTVAAHTISSTPISRTPKTRHVADRAASDLVRLQLLRTASAILALPPRGIAKIMAHAISAWQSRSNAVDDLARHGDGKDEDDDGGGGNDDDDGAVRGFDLIALRHVELHDPMWNLRGEWHGDRPSAPFDDPTLGEHERHLLGGARTGPATDAAVRPDAHLDSHGVLRVALDRCSFVGARLVGVFFFGHRFCEASFVGAVLDRCAFIGCTFERCAFVGAAVLHCGFWDCERVVEGAAKPLTLRKVCKVIRSRGGIL